jgi:ADP-L-glycero-D-manno-heptose 6-epimerase
MIVVTGAGGFIGSAVVWLLNVRGTKTIIAVDALDTVADYANLNTLDYSRYLSHEEFIAGLERGEFEGEIEGIIHMGACSDTTERDWDYLRKNNTEFTERLARWALDNGKRFVYASSAATYGDGSAGFSDEHRKLHLLKPLNLYGESKHLFDLWAYRKDVLGKIAGLKYFNVYGPNEYHKGGMRSMVHKSFCQIQEIARITLFKSNHPDYSDGGQLRDFIYVKDAVKMTLFVYDNKAVNGIINCGTGVPRSFNDLAHAVFRSMERETCIEYVEMPEALKAQYQSYTRADMGKLRKFGYQEKLYSLEDGITDYVRNYLLTENPYLNLD